MNVIGYITNIIRTELEGSYINVDKLIDKINNDANIKNSLLQSSLMMFDDNSNIHAMRIDEFLFIEYREKRHYFHTLDNVFTLCNKKIDIIPLLTENYIEARKGVMVNLSKIIKYHSYNLLLNFTESDRHEKDVQCTNLCMVKHIKPRLGQQLDSFDQTKHINSHSAYSY